MQQTILFCLDFYYPHLGGAEVLFANLAEGLVREGRRVIVVTQRVKGSLPRENHLGVEIYRVFSFGNRYLFALLCIPLLWKLAGRAQLMHATTFASTIPAWVVSKLRRCPLVLTVHEVWAGHWQEYSDASRFFNWVNDKIERMVYWLDYGHYVAVSHATARGLQSVGVPESAIHVIHNGLEYSRWTPAGLDRLSIRQKLGLENHFVFFFSGRPGCSKGLPVLLKAFAAVSHRHPDVRLLALVSRSAAVRKGYEEAKMLVDNLGIGGSVDLHAPVPVDELPSYVVSADAVVVPSLSEGFGFAAAEACAMERPVIVSDNASLPEVVSGKVLMVPPGDVSRLEEAMEQALKGEYQDIPKRVFLQEDNLRKHIQLYEAICGRQENGPAMNGL